MKEYKDGKEQLISINKAKAYMIEKVIEPKEKAAGGLIERDGVDEVTVQDAQPVYNITWDA